jgi:hypothetical protein
MKTCQEITGLYEQAKIGRISLSEKFAVRTHRSMCKNCRTYFKDSDLLDKMLRRQFKDLGNHNFSMEEKAKMKEQLKKD